MSFIEKTQEEIALLNPEELKIYNANKKAYDAEVAKEAKKGKSTAKEDKSAGATQRYYDEQGAKTLKNHQKRVNPVTVDLTRKTLVEFTEDFGFFKKGASQEVSDVALAIYEKAGVITKL